MCVESPGAAVNVFVGRGGRSRNNDVRGAGAGGGLVEGFGKEQVEAGNVSEACFGAGISLQTLYQDII